MGIKWHPCQFYALICFCTIRLVKSFIKNILKNLYITLNCVSKGGRKSNYIKGRKVNLFVLSCPVLSRSGFFVQNLVSYYIQKILSKARLNVDNKFNLFLRHLHNNKYMYINNALMYLSLYLW